MPDRMTETLRETVDNELRTVLPLSAKLQDPATRKILIDCLQLVEGTRTKLRALLHK